MSQGDHLSFERTVWVVEKRGGCLAVLPERRTCRFLVLIFLHSGVIGDELPPSCD